MLILVKHKSLRKHTSDSLMTIDLSPSARQLNTYTTGLRCSLAITATSASSSSSTTTITTTTSLVLYLILLLPLLWQLLLMLLYPILLLLLLLLLLLQLLLGQRRQRVLCFAASEGYPCERCSKVFAYKYYRDKHLKYTRCVDQGDRKYPCHLCSRWVSVGTLCVNNNNNRRRYNGKEMFFI